jgi:prepilin-type N-terminal cleavage/methylation domain-containing protein
MVKRKKQKGFTLVEILIALALSLVGLMGLMALQLLAVRSNANSRNFAEATALAQEKIESLQSTSYVSIAAATESNLGATPGATLTPYTRITTVADNGSYKTISVAVSWSDDYRAGKTHAVTLYLVKSP